MTTPEAQSSTGPSSAAPGRRFSRRTLLGIAVPLLLVVGWFLVTGMVRRHVDGQIQRTVGEKLTPFALRDTGGSEWTPERLRGRPALLHFFRSRCESCDREAEAWRAFEGAVGETASILHVCTDKVLEFPADETTATIARKQFVRPVLLADSAFVESFHRATWSNVTPVTYVVDADCRIIKALRGAQTLPELVSALASAR